MSWPFRNDGKINGPCRRDCPDRAQNCHAACARYAEYRAGRLKVYEARAEYTEQVKGVNLTRRKSLDRKVRKRILDRSK